MAAIFVFLFRFLRVFRSGHQAVAFENLALRQEHVGESVSGRY